MPFRPTSFGTVIATHDPGGDAAFFIENFEYEAVAVLDWYVSLSHPTLPNQFLDFIDPDSDRCPLQAAPEGPATLMLAMIVDDAQAEAERLIAAGHDLLKELTDEPWGQRVFQIAGPGATIIEIVQRIPPDKKWLEALGN